MGIRFSCPNGHKLNVKSFLAGKRAICPQCGVKVVVPNAAEPNTLTDSDSPGASAKPSDVGAIPAFTAPAATTASPLIVIEAAEPVSSRLGDSQNGGDILAAPEVATLPLPAVIAPSTPETNPAANASSLGAVYFARRERKRRNQLRVAVGLLVAVIALAVVLVWVLRQRGATNSRSTSRLSVYTAKVTVPLPHLSTHLDPVGELEG